MNEGSFSERVTDLQCYPQNIDGICNLLVDVLLHQLLTHPQTQAAHSDAPEPHELLISHSRITQDVTFVKCRRTLKALTFMMSSPSCDYHLNMNLSDGKKTHRTALAPYLASSQCSLVAVSSRMLTR